MVEYVKKLPLEKLKKYRYPALVLVLGLLFLLLPTGKQETVEPSGTSESSGFDLETFTQEAQRVLSQVAGAGQVQLLLTLDTDGHWDYLSDRTASQGENALQTQEQAVLMSQEGAQKPVTVERRYPEFRGALVLCQGEPGPGLTLALKEALSSLTGLGMDKITVLRAE